MTKLTDSLIKGLLPMDNPYRVSDGGGLQISVPLTCAKVWRFQYRYAGRSQVVTIGPYPEISINEAREWAAEARRNLANGINPADLKKALKLAAQEDIPAGSLKALTLEFLENHRIGRSEKYNKNIQSSANSHLFPFLGNRLITEIEPEDLLSVLRQLEADYFFDAMKQIRILVSHVFKYALAAGIVKRDIASELKAAIKKDKVKHFPALVGPQDLKRVLAAIDDYIGYLVVKTALQLAPLTIVQTRELRLAEWSEFDFNKNVWTIPAEKMKMPWPHIVPLSTQALAILEELRPFTGQGRYLFSNPLKETRPISDFTLLKALGSMGFSKNEMVVEGFRSIARNKLMEMGYSLDWINLQLTQAPGGVWESYNYAAFLPERRKMMQHWADYLDSLKLGENI